MEVCKNKDSGKYFIYLQDCGPGDVLLVTPGAQVKPLRANFFDDIEDFSEKYLIENSFISEDQIRKYKEFQQNRTDDEIENIIEISGFENMTPHQQRIFIQQLQEKAAKL